VEYVNLVGRRLGLALPATLVFDYANIRLLAGHLAREVFGWSDAVTAAPEVPAPAIEGDLDAALVEFEATSPEDHWDELGIWRLIELKKSVYKLKDHDGELKPWEARLVELASETDAIDELLAEVEQAVMEADEAARATEQGQLETLGSLLTGLVGQQQGGEHSSDPESVAEQAGAPANTHDGSLTDVLMADPDTHRVIMRDGNVFEGSWEEIVQALRDARDAGRPLDEFMAMEARRFYGATGMRVASHAPEAFLRGGADAGMLRIVR
jgi:hypothetical protein